MGWTFCVYLIHSWVLVNIRQKQPDMIITNHTNIISPSSKMSNELSRLSIIAALSHVMGLWQLKEQAIQMHDKLVDAYNSQLPKNKPKGFWRQFLDNITFNGLDITIALPLEKLRDSESLQNAIDLYSDLDKNQLVTYLYKVLDNEMY